MAASTSTSFRNPRITEEEEHLDNVPLLQHSDSHEDLEHGRRKSTAFFPAAQVSVIFILGLIFIFAFILSTVCFGVLYYRISESSVLKGWPKPSNSLFGQYTKSAVAADNTWCSEIGRDTLLKGGNAIDAAVSTLICIGVMDVQSSGLGGGHLLTFYNATSKRCHVIDARETAPIKSDKDMYKNKYEEAQFGWRAIAVPGELHGLWTAYKLFGSYNASTHGKSNVTWSSLIQPTIELMEEGHPTSHALAIALERLKKPIDPVMKKAFTNEKTGQLYKIGDQVTTRQDFIETLKKLANSKDPVELFYKGEMMQQIVDEFKSKGSPITEEDFRSYESKVRKDEDVIYVDLGNGIRGCGPPPPSGAAVTLSILNMLKNYPTDTKTIDGYTKLYHRYLESSKFAYASRSELGDIDFVNNSRQLAKNITSNEYAQLMKQYITEHAHPTEYYGGNFSFRTDHGTSHVSIIDSEGNAVSVTSTINLYLGSQVMSESTGIVWNNEMDDFSLPGHPNYFGIPPSESNYIMPKKRPQSSMSPLVFFSDKSVLSIGGAGGSHIISGVAYAAMHILFSDSNVKEAIDFPRLHNQLRPNQTEYEAGFLPELINKLEERGQNFANSSRATVLTAVIKKFKGNESAVYANSDFRKGSESEPAGF